MAVDTATICRMTTGRGLTDPTCVLIRMHRSRSGQFWADSPDIPGYTAVGDDPFEVMGLVREFADLTPPMVDHPVTDVRWQWCDDPAAHVVGIRWSRSGTLPEATIPPPCRCESARPEDAR